MLHEFFSQFDTAFLRSMLHSVFAWAPVWVPILFAIVWFDLWLHYKQREWIKKQESVLLEIRLPQELPKSPHAMELFINTLYDVFPGNLIKVYLEGAQRQWFSLELVSIDGTIHFYIWCLKARKNRVETQLYAQFPNVEVHEVPDYTLGVHHNPDKLSFGWIGQLKLTKADAYPIKTYIEYGLHEDPDEEFKHDPLVSLLEFLGSLKKGEQAWVQILIQGHTKEGLTFHRLFPKADWKGGVEKEIKEILKKGRLKPEDDKTLDSTKHLSQGQRDVIEAIERNASKTAFDAMIRTTYFAEKEVFNPGNIGGLLGSFSHFSSQDLNGFRPDFKASFDYPWQDLFGKKKAYNERQLLAAYKRRSFFSPPFKHFHAHPFILTTEELATLFHFPSGIVAATPTLERIPSKKAQAPANLPV
ncbi:hypothetical protein KW785_00800 [Candidatus Parcubacteria bacterium]|nr:hypothetical protein [Candidatus Parcubacteria bacterium]